MSYPVISVENLSKSYRLGQIGTGTLTNDLKLWWAKKRGLPNPLLKIGQTDHGNRDGEELWALRDVSFTVQQGEVLGIIGRNGAGKSTLLKILSRVTAPTGGCVKVRGRIASLLEVGTGFHPELTGRENIYLNGAILGMSREEVRRKFDEIVAFAEVEKFIDTPVKRYSSGMYVRLAFAVAAHLESEILLVDEVLAVGDAEFQKKCLGKMGDVASNEGRTVLFVSHNMAAIKNICNRAVLLSKGIVTVDGVPSVIIEEYIAGNHDQDLSAFRFLDNATRKRGSQEVRVSQIFLVDNKHNQKSRFAVWEPIEVTASIQAPSGRKFASVWVLIYSADGEVVLSAFQSDFIDDFYVTYEETEVSLKIDPNYLVPGRYSLSIGIFGKQKDFYEWIDNALIFEILPEFVNGKPYDNRLGKTTANYVWKVNG